MKKFIMLAVAVLMFITENAVYADAANNQSTVAVTVSAEVPADWTGDIFLVYQLADGSGPKYSFSLNNDNNYSLRQTVLKGKYSCIEMEAKGCDLSLKKTVQLDKGTNVVVVASPHNSLDNLTEVSTGAIDFVPSSDSNAWMIAVGVLVVLLLAVIIIFARSVR